MLFKIVSTAPIISICKTYISKEFFPNQEKILFNFLLCNNISTIHAKGIIISLKAIS